MSRVFIIACEASGDKHGADLVNALKCLDPSLEFQGLGGTEMERAGVMIHTDMTRLAVLGFGDVLRKYFQFRKIFFDTLRRIGSQKPDLLILIDSPAFNLRLAKKIKRKIPVLYYISPQIWAWGWRRIHTIRRTVNHIFSILPFEEEMYRKENVPCTFIGHPLLDRTRASQPREALREEFNLSKNDLAITLLAGSREPEIRRILPILLRTAGLLKKQMPGLKFFLSRAPHVSPETYRDILEKFPEHGCEMKTDRIYDYVAASDFAWVASGTATLETALVGTPFFLIYKASASTFFLGRRLVKIPYIGLVNVLAGKLVVPEYIQHRARPEEIAAETRKLLLDPLTREQFRSEIQSAIQKLGPPGAVDRAARLVFSLGLLPAKSSAQIR